MALANSDVNLNSSITDTTTAGYGIIFDTAGNPVNYRLTGYSGNTFTLKGSLTLSEASVGGPPATATAIMDPSLAVGSIDTVYVEPNVDLAMPSGATVVPVNVTLDGVSASGQTPVLTIYSGNSAPSYVYANGKGVLNIVGSVNYSNTLAEKQLGSSFEIENGTLVLTGIQNFANTGNLIIDSGAGLTIKNYGLLNKPNAVQVNGTLTLSGVNLTIQALDGSGSISLGSNYLEIQKTSGDFSGTISGSGGLRIDGNLGLTKNSGYSGSTTVGSGATLFLKKAGSIGSSRVVNSGVLDISKTTAGASVKSLSGSGAVQLGGQTLTLTDAGDSFTGNIQGSGGLTIAGGTETLTANNSYTGQTSVDTGATLKLSGSGALGGNGSVTDNGELNFTSGDTSSFGGKISGAGTVVIDGNSRATLSASSDYTGATTINGGSTLLLSGSGSIGSSAVQDDGTLDISGTSAGGSVGSIAGAGGVNLGGQTLTISQAAGTLGGIIQGSGGLTIAAGTETLTGNNTYTGLTTIDSSATLALSGSGSFQVQSKLLDNGTLAFENANRTWSASISGSGGVKVDGGSATLTGANGYTGATAITAGSTLNLTGGGSIAGSTVGDDGVLDISGASGATSVMALAGSGHVNLGANTLKVSQAAGDLSGGISGTGGLEIAGGKQTLSGANAYTGTSTIDSSATLALSGTGSLGSSSVADGGTLDISGTSAGATVAGLSGSGGVSLGGQTLSLGNGGGNILGGVITGSGGVSLLAGRQILTGTNTYTGTTTIDSGATLALSGTGSLGASPVADAGTLDIAGTTAGASVGSIAGTGGVSLGGQTLTITQAAGTLAGTIAGSGGLTIAGGTETLTGNSVYTGLTTIDSGATLALSGTGSFANPSKLLDNGTLAFENANRTWSASITGGGGVTVDGGHASLGAVNAYTGATTIVSGSTLFLVASGSIAHSPVADAGTLDIAGTTAGASVGSIAGAGGVSLGAQTLTITQAAGTLAGPIAGSGGLTIAGGTETLSGNSVYTGLTTIDTSATLALSGTGSFADPSKLLDNGTLAFENANRTWSAAITGSGGVKVDGGNATLTAANGYTGATTITSGSTLLLTGSGSIAGSTVDDGGVLDISGSSSGSSVGSLAGAGQVSLGGRTLTVTAGRSDFTGTISGSAGLDIAGGTQTLSGINTYSGSTTIDPGATLALAGTGSLGSSPVVDRGTLDISGTSAGATVASLSGSGGVDLGGQTLNLSNGGGNTLGGVIAGGGGLKLLAGTQTLTGANTYAGVTNIAAGATLALAGGGSLGASPVADAGTLDISGTTAGASVGSIAGAGGVTLGAQTLSVTQASGTFAGTIQGTGGLNIAGGTEILDAAATYTGTTSIGRSATLTLGSAGSLAATPVVADGALDVSGSAVPLDIPTLSGSGAVNLGGNELVLSQASGVFSGQIAGHAGLRLLAGQETLGGTDTYTGDTQVQGGTLALGNQAMLASRLLVQAAGGVRTQGNARVAQDLDNSGGLILTQDAAVSPALSVAGNYTQASNATLTVDIAPASNARLEVLGSQLNLGGHLVIAAAPGKYLRRSYLLVDAPASTTLNGTFTDWQVQGLSASDYEFSLQYVSDPQVIFSLVALHAFSGGSQTPNENNLGTALDSLIPTAGPGLLARLQALFGQDSVARALETMDGEVYSETPGWLLQGTGREWSRLFDRLGMGQGGDALDPRQHSFAFITGSRGQLLGDGNALGLDESSSGLTIGHQRRVGPWMLGAAAGTLELGATRHLIGDGATTQLYRGGLFAGRDLGRLRVGSLLGYSGGRVHYGSSERDARIWTWQSRLDRPFALRSGDVLTPIAGLDLQHLRLSAARESDPVLGLVVPRQSAYTLSMLGALRVTRAVSWRDSVGTLNASLGVRHWFRRPPSELRFGFTGIEGLQFSDSGVASPRNVLEATLGAQAKLRRNLEAQVSWQASIGHSLRENQLQARLSWSF